MALPDQFDIGEASNVFSSPQDGLRMRLFLLSMAILFMALTIRPGPEIGPTASSGASETRIPGIHSVPEAIPTTPPYVFEAQMEEEWYRPSPEDFRPAYDRDATNREKQTWDEYWRWVKVFYEGNLLSYGWTARSIGLVAELKSAPEQMRVRATLNAIGKEIASEWAKDYDIRKVSSADLLTWGKILEKAKANDDKSGAELRRAIRSIRDEHLKKRLSADN